MEPRPPLQPIASTAALARHLGVSRWTISQVLNGHPRVAEETRARIQSAMSEMGFSPSLFGRALRGARTSLVGLCVPELITPTLASKVQVFQEIMRSFNYNTLIEITGSAELQASAIRHFSALKVEGMVLFQNQSPRIVKMLRDARIPVVMVDCHAPGFSSVSCDRSLAMEMHMDHLLDLGHSRFAFLGMNDFRWNEYQKLFKKHRIRPDRDVRVFAKENYGIHDAAYGKLLAEEFLSSRWDATAVIAHNDYMGIVAMGRFLRAGMRVPQDVSVVGGFENMDVDDYLLPSLTSIDQRVDVIMKTAAELLLAQIRGESRKATKRVEPILVVRGSTGPARAGRTSPRPHAQRPKHLR